jgi:hypothetical protein
MKPRLLLTLVLLALLGGLARAQVSMPKGRFKVIATSEGHLGLDSDRITCILADSADPIPNDLYYLSFFADTLIEESFHFSIDPRDGTVLSSNTISIREIQPTFMARGASWFWVARNCLHSRYYRQVGDSLWLNRMTEGELPISFETGGTRLIDTLGLQVLLPTLGCIADKSKAVSINIYIDDPEINHQHRKDLRLASKRLAVLQRQLQLGLGKSFDQVKLIQQNSSTQKTNYTVTYRLSSG